MDMFDLFFIAIGFFATLAVLSSVAVILRKKRVGKETKETPTTSKLKRSQKRPVKAIVMDEKLTEYDLGPVGNLPASIKHGDTTLEVDPLFMFKETNWRGKTKGWFLFYDLVNLTPGATNPKSIKPLGLKDFDPEKEMSAEEADLYIHETKTSSAVSNIVQKLKVGGSFKFWMFIIILIVVAVAATIYFKLR